MKFEKRFVVAGLAILCFLVALFVMVPTLSSPGVGDYDPWIDLNDDGVIDGSDIIVVARAFGTSGTPMTKAGLLYDSGWIDITGKARQEFDVTHNLNSTDIIVDITGKTTVDGGAHQKHLGLTAYTPGWNQTYGGTNYDIAECIIQTSDRGYALAGRTESFGAGQYDFWLVKTDVDGNMQWNQTYGGTGSEQARSVVQTGDGGYALAGSTDSFGAGNGDFWLVKTDADGNHMWNKTYGGTYYDIAYSIVQTGDGGYAIAGYTTSFGAGGQDFWLVKTDADGNHMWNKTYGGTINDRALSVVQTGDGGYAIAGETYSFGAGYSNFWLVKTDADGNHMWNKTYGGTYYDYAYSVVETGDGGYALAGATISFGAGSYDFWLVKTGAESGLGYGLSWTDSTADTITLYRGSTDTFWNYVRVRIWKIKETP